MFQAWTLQLALELNFPTMARGRRPISELQAGDSTASTISSGATDGAKLRCTCSKRCKGGKGISRSTWFLHAPFRQEDERIQSEADQVMASLFPVHHEDPLS